MLLSTVRVHYCYTRQTECHSLASTALAGAPASSHARSSGTMHAGCPMLLLLVHERDHRAPARAKEHTHAQPRGGNWERLCGLVAGSSCSALAHSGPERARCRRAWEAQAAELALTEHVDARAGGRAGA